VFLTWVVKASPKT